MATLALHHTPGMTIVGRTLFPFLGLLLSVPACGPPQTTWPKFHHDQQQSGLSQFSTAANNGSPKWRFKAGGGISSSPAIADDGTIYFGSDDRNVYALNPGGSLKWKSPTGGAVASSPALGNGGVIYVVSTDGNLYAINPDGTQTWKLPLAGSSHASPAVGSDGIIYVGTNDGNFLAVNALGAQKWKTFLYPGASITTCPAIGADGTLYFGAESPTFYALDTAGAQTWTFSHKNPGASAAAVATDGTIYFGSQDGNLYALNPDGSLKWSFRAGRIVRSAPAIAADGTIYFGSTDSNLYAVTAAGMLKWKFPADGAIRGSSPAIGSDGTVYIGTESGNLYAVDAAGSLKWKYHTAGAVRSSPAIGSDGTVYFGSEDGGLYAVGPPRPAELYIVDDGDAKAVLVHDLETWNGTPLRTISGSNTGLHNPEALAVDDLHDEVMVANYGAPASITTYAATAAGDVSPVRTLLLAHNPLDLFIDTANDELFVVYGGTEIDVFPRTANGNASPIRTLKGPSTKIRGAFTITVDTVNNEIFLGNSWEVYVTVYPRTASGDTAPIRTLQGSNTGLCTMSSIAVDPLHNELIVGSSGNGALLCSTSVNVYDRMANGNTPALRTIQGSPGLVPLAITLDLARDTIISGNAGGRSVQAYSRTANGISTPLHTLTWPDGARHVPRGVGVRNTPKIIVLNAVATGRYSNAGSHTPGNYAAGWYRVGTDPQFEARDYFVFDLSKVTGKIKSATLRLTSAPTGFIRYASSDPSETYSLFDVSTAPTVVSGGAGGIGAFDDLGSGTSYGNLVATNALEAIVEIPLNAAGITLLSTNFGQVTIGGAIATLAKGTTNEGLFNGTSASLTRQLVITTE